MGVTRHPLCDDDGRLPGVPRDRAAIRRVRSNLARLTAERVDVVGAFYALLFERHPHLRALFPLDLADVQCRMRAALTLCVARWHEPESLSADLARLGLLHASRGVRPEHYPLACECLVAALRRASGEHWDDELEAEWRETLRAICARMIAATT